MSTSSAPAKSHRPQAYTVFGAAIVAGAAAAFGLNSALDTHLAQARPRVESEAILVALRALPAGAPVTVWDVGLRDWPKAMIPSTAMRLTDDLENLVVRHPLREGQPILAVQLGRIDTAGDSSARPLAVAATPTSPIKEPEQDLWGTPATTPSTPLTAAQVPAAPVTPVAASPATTVTTVTTVSTAFAAGTAPLPPPVASSPATDASTASRGASPSPDAQPSVTAERRDPPAAELAATTPLTIPEEPITTPGAAHDPLRLPSPEASTAAIATAPQPTDPTVSSPPREVPIASGDTPPAPLRTAVRPRPSVVQALSVPNPESMRADAAGTTADDARAAGMTGRVASTSAVAGRDTATSVTVDHPPRMLPASGPVATATVPAAPHAAQARPRTAASTSRSARAQAPTRGYRPN